MEKLLNKYKERLLKITETHEYLDSMKEELLEALENINTMHLSEKINLIHKLYRFFIEYHGGIYKNEELLSKIRNTNDPMWEDIVYIPIEDEIQKNLAATLIKTCRIK